MNPIMVLVDKQTEKTVTISKKELKRIIDEAFDQGRLYTEQHWWRCNPSYGTGKDYITITPTYTDHTEIVCKNNGTSTTHTTLS